MPIWGIYPKNRFAEGVKQYIASAKSIIANEAIKLLNKKMKSLIIVRMKT